MPRFDKYHEIVKLALVKDGWKITDDPLILEFKDLTLYADLGAERTFAAEKDDEKIAVEIKTFEAFL
ncbi:MAG: element excision factor XisH family protein [Aridibacter sp.]